VRPEERLPLNPRDFLILLILTRGARHGYGIIKAAEAHGGHAIRFDPANLYRALRRLDRDDLVAVSAEATAPSEGLPRRSYALT
jgi:PadR family transcriptional regulator PadR